MRGSHILLGLGATGALALSWALPRLDAPLDRQSVAVELIENGRGAEAIHLLEDRAWRGIAEYRANRFRRATTEFVQDESVMSLYNLGTAFARLAEWSSARTAYERVLSLDPGHEDAAFNLALVVQAEARQQEEQEEQRQSRTLGSEKGEPGNDDQQGDTENAETTTDGARASQDVAPTENQASQSGQISAEGRTGEEAQNPGSAAGRADASETDERDSSGQMGAGGMRLLTRSTQDTEVLLRGIRDDPARVLAARLRAIQRQRLAAGQ